MFENLKFSSSIQKYVDDFVLRNMPVSLQEMAALKYLTKPEIIANSKWLTQKTTIDDLRNLTSPITKESISDIGSRVRNFTACYRPIVIPKIDRETMPPIPPIIPPGGPIVPGIAPRPGYLTFSPVIKTIVPGRKITPFDETNFKEKIGKGKVWCNIGTIGSEILSVNDRVVNNINQLGNLTISVTDLKNYVNSNEFLANIGSKIDIIIPTFKGHTITTMYEKVFGKIAGTTMEIRGVMNSQELWGTKIDEFTDSFKPIGTFAKSSTAMKTAFEKIKTQTITDIVAKSKGAVDGVFGSIHEGVNGLSDRYAAYNFRDVGDRLNEIAGSVKDNLNDTRTKYNTKMENMKTIAGDLADKPRAAFEKLRSKFESIKGSWARSETATGSMRWALKQARKGAREWAGEIGKHSGMKLTNWGADKRFYYKNKQYGKVLNIDSGPISAGTGMKMAMDYINAMGSIVRDGVEDMIEDVKGEMASIRDDFVALKATVEGKAANLKMPTIAVPTKASLVKFRTDTGLPDVGIKKVAGKYSNIDEINTVPKTWTEAKTKYPSIMPKVTTAGDIGFTSMPKLEMPPIPVLKYTQMVPDP